MAVEDEVYINGETFGQWTTKYNKALDGNLKGLGYTGNDNKVPQVNDTGSEFEFNYSIKRIEIGPWDMSNPGSIILAHSIGALALSALVFGSIIRDDGNVSYPLWSQGDLNDRNGGFYEIDSTNITLNRTLGNFFSSSGLFVDPLINRGHIWFMY